MENLTVEPPLTSSTPEPDVSSPTDGFSANESGRETDTSQASAGSGSTVKKPSVTGAPKRLPGGSRAGIAGTKPVTSKIATSSTDTAGGGLTKPPARPPAGLTTGVRKSS